MEYEYWNRGDKKPETLPEGCEYYFDGRWNEELDRPFGWISDKRRWPKESKKPENKGTEKISEQKTWHMWSPGDKVPEETPKNCELFSFTDRVWKATILRVDDWERSYYRWPAEPAKPKKQRPTAFGLLSEEEQAEIREAKKLGNVEFLSRDGWASCGIYYAPYASYTYRIKPQTPQERYNFKVTVNGEPIDPKSMSESSWMNLRGGE